MRNALRSYLHSLILCCRTHNMQGIRPKILSFYRNTIILGNGARIIADDRVHLAARRTVWPGACFIKLGPNSTLHFQGQVTIRAGVRIILNSNAELTIGHDSILQESVHIAVQQRITMGQKAYIGQDSIIMDSDFHNILINNQLRPMTEPIQFEDRVWLGVRCIVLKGVHIGHDSIIGAGSLVARDIPAHTLAVGNPARPRQTIDKWGFDPQNEPLDTPS